MTKSYKEKEFLINGHYVICIAYFYVNETCFSKRLKLIKFKLPQIFL